MITYSTNPYGSGNGVWPKGEPGRLERRGTRRRFLARIPGLAWRGVKLVARVLWEALKLYLYVLFRVVFLCLRAI